MVGRRRSGEGGAWWTASAAVAAALACLAASLGPARAQDLPSLVTLANRPTAPQTRLLVEADNLVYEIKTEQIAAVGNVTIYYGTTTLTADRVDLDRRTRRVVASGSVEIVDADGNVLTGERIELTDDLRYGVAQGLEVITADRTAFTAARAQRSEGNVTTFEDGVYLPCVDCNGEIGRKPIWQIRAKRIVHRQGDRTITFERATFEFAGVPLAWVPVLTQPDPTVRRKSGFLAPSPVNSNLRGLGVITPYFYVLAPNMDLTVSPGYFTRQGLYGDAEWRHRLDNGVYSLRVTGLRQNDPAAFAGTSGDREWRGSVESLGRFTINPRWSWGWDVALATDRSYFNDYRSGTGSAVTSTNQLFLSGVDERNRFDSSVLGFFVQQEDSTNPNALPQDVGLQSKQPIVHPVIDHSVYAPKPVYGGEFRVNSNLTSLTRQRTDIFVFDGGTRERLRGPAGTFTRGTIDALWRRRMVDSAGQVFTPFAYVRGDVFFLAPDADTGFETGEDAFAARAMPAAGLEYSYPIAIDSAFGRQVIEPVAQLIVRPNETETGDVPNEDAQSLVFDTSSLFDFDKFSGYDRAEGGTRMNLGVRYSAALWNGITVDGAIGQSFQVFGRNSFEADTPYQTGTESGLDKTASDIVASLGIVSSRGLTFTAATRVDDESFQANRVEAQLIGQTGPLTAGLTYAFIRKEPERGIDNDRSELQAAGSLRLDANWRLFGSARLDLINEDLIRHAFGIAYDLEEFSLSLSYFEDRVTGSGEPDQTIFLRLGFRGLGETQANSELGD